MKSFANKLAELDLKAKTAAVFGTNAGKERTVDRAMKKLELIAKEKLLSLNLISPEPSVRMNGVPGPAA